MPRLPPIETGMTVLIIQTGDATISARQYGNFDDWFKQAIPNRSSQTIHVHRGEPLPDQEAAQDSYSHIIITGSAAMVTAQQRWMRETQHWLSLCIEDIPTLGVCFGHQLLADLLGGHVDYNPLGRSMGRSVCTLTAEGVKDPLFNGSEQASFSTWVSHLQSVLALPTSCARLASSEKDQNHVFRYQKHVYGVQFHPEWNGLIMQAYIKDRLTDLKAEAFDVPAMVPTKSETENNHSLIQHFLDHCQ